jgi:hypothetical protein
MRKKLIYQRVAQHASNARHCAHGPSHAATRTDQRPDADRQNFDLHEVSSHPIHRRLRQMEMHAGT